MGTDIFNTKRDSKFEYATTSAFVQSSSGVHCRGRHELQRGTSSPLCTALLRRAAKKFPEFLWLKKCDNWFNMIEEWPSWSWNKKLASLTDQFMRFCPTIRRWDLLVRSLFRVVSASRWRTEPHIAYCAAIPCREKHSCHHPTTVLSGSRSEWLSAVSYSENVPQGDAFRSM